uniref:Thioredoxin domain-containing protein n=1 Tax=Chromera velia CCMP2878 TaxID=1169474 RepID=A0A0G4HWK3_9ALVE|eukprot:Cvel_32692.t1-p1 / transcript=Cvel_32692.t1 / gene=Cvel_32692 / organism=Chromera_velia_CCMP2878 / gene_product=Protein disulfide-isomerase, putative / transcript_product=Protein disulfide-isomerase, putative / location=Cvel_scaffold5140:576-2336(-) / protein_length=587 / sequence_SO=supercontig / SO=protein_coding / is_pseudo=false
MVTLCSGKMMAGRGLPSPYPLFLLLFFLFAVSAASSPVAGGGGAAAAASGQGSGAVKDLSDANFEMEKHSHSYVLALFYAPWCPLSKRFLPEFERASEALSHKKEGFFAAKIDCTANPKVCSAEKIRSYPTLKLFSLKDPDRVYRGGRTAPRLVEWVERAFEPPVTDLPDLLSARSFIKKHPLTAMAFFPQDREFSSSAAGAAFNSVAVRLSGSVSFAVMRLEEREGEAATAEDIRVWIGPSAVPVVVMFKPFEEVARFPLNLETCSEDALGAFVAAHQFPMVQRFDASVATELFESNRPILAVLLDHEPSAAEGAEAAAWREKGMHETDSRDRPPPPLDALLDASVREAAERLRDSVAVTVAAADDFSDGSMAGRLMDFVGVGEGDLPAVRVLLDPAVAEVRKFAPEDDPAVIRLLASGGEGGQRERMHVAEVLSPSVLESFVNNVLDGRVPQKLKGQPVPQTQTGPVYELVAETFEAVVMNEQLDVLVMMYAPFCGHSRRLEPLYLQVAERFAKFEHLLIARIDAYNNDRPSRVPGAELNGFPTIRLWPSKSKQAPVDFEGERDPEVIAEFIFSHSSKPMTRDEL